MLHPLHYVFLDEFFNFLSCVMTRKLDPHRTNFKNIGRDPVFLEGRWWHTLMFCLDIVTPIKLATFITRSYTSSSMISSTPKVLMLSLQPHCSFEPAQDKFVISASFDGGDVLLSWNTNATLKPKKRVIQKVSRYALCQPYRCPRSAIFAVQTGPSALDDKRWPINIALLVCHSLSPCFGGLISKNMWITY